MNAHYNGEEHACGKRYDATVIYDKSYGQRENKQRKEHHGADTQHESAKACKPLAALEFEKCGIVVSDHRRTACGESAVNGAREQKCAYFHSKECLKYIEKHNENTPEPSKVNEGVAGSEIFSAAFTNINVLCAA